MEKISKILFEMQDTNYKAFSSSLIPTVNPDTVIGVKTPLIRKLAKNISKSSDVNEFIHELPHKYFEENNLHAFIICSIKDYDECVRQINGFLPFVDNWATCDSMKPISFSTNKAELLKQIEKWIDSDKEYTVRFGVGMLMTHFLGDDFKIQYAEKVAAIKSEKYYINMMIAWYFATALAKNYNEVLPFIKGKRLSPWVHKKTIQKAIESFRISNEQKAFLRQLK